MIGLTTADSFGPIIYDKLCSRNKNDPSPNEKESPIRRIKDFILSIWFKKIKPKKKTHDIKRRKIKIDNIVYIPISSRKLLIFSRLFVFPLAKTSASLA